MTALEPTPTVSRFRLPDSRPVEFLLLLGMVATLPLFEAPKNLFWLGFVLTWLVNRFRSKHWGGAWDGWDSLIALWIASGYIVALFAGLHHSEWGGANDILRYGLVLWLVKRSGYRKEAFVWILAVILFSTFVALAHGLMPLLGGAPGSSLELNSVGHVNHSVIYLAIAYGAGLSALLAFWRLLGVFGRLAGAILIAGLAAGIVLSASRGGIGVMALNTFVLGAFWLKRSRIPLLLMVSATLAVATMAYVAKIEVVKKQEALIQSKNILSSRGEVWNTALAAWKMYPLFGVGMGNYSRITEDKLEEWHRAKGQAFDPSRYFPISHAHNLYLNTLAERGMFGFAVMAAVLAGWLAWLFRHAPVRDDADIAWALWGSSLSAWLVTVGVGFVNTTLHHEHAILAVLLLAIWLGYLKSDELNPVA